MNKNNKSKEKFSAAAKRPSTSQSQTYEEIFQSVPEEEKLRQDAYKISIKSITPKECIYPYIPITTTWISPIEKKFSHLSADELIMFYLKKFIDPFYYPKDFLYYQDILIFTGSVKFESTVRTDGELAFSKAYINKIITPEQWESDLYTPKEITIENFNKRKLYFNYFDYIKAWDFALCYDNRKRKHSWSIEFGEHQTLNFPNWFIVWFCNWGLYPIILPHKIRLIYEGFVNTNPSLNNPGLIFTVLYKIPWIIKWDVVVSNRKLEKLNLSFEIPYLGRRILIKWWGKFDFFKESIFSIKGIINLESSKIIGPPVPENDKGISEIVNDLLSGNSNKRVKK